MQLILLKEWGGKEEGVLIGPIKQTLKIFRKAVHCMKKFQN